MAANSNQTIPGQMTEKPFAQSTELRTNANAANRLEMRGSAIRVMSRRPGEVVQMPGARWRSVVMIVQKVQSVVSSLSKAWCTATHPDPMWPVNGLYRCPRCMRQYPVPWETRAKQPTVITAPVVRAPRGASPQPVA